jgi:hypothetical protein
MRKIYAAIVLIISLCALAVVTGFTAKTTQTKAQNEIVNTVKVANTKTTKTGSKNLIKYQLDVNAPILTLSSPQIRNINIDLLKKEIGKDNVGVDLKQQQLYLNLKDNIDNKGKGSFKVETLSNQKMIIGFSDLSEEQLLITMFNDSGNDVLNDSIKDEESKEKDDHNDQKATVSNPETNHSAVDDQSAESNDSSADKNPTRESEDEDGDEDDNGDLDGEDVDDNIGENPNIVEDEDNPKNGWSRTNNMMITPGHPIKNSDGSKTYPVIYFGAINYALQGITIRDAVAGRPLRTGVLGLLGKTAIGKGRKDNVTAANTALIKVPQNGNMNDQQVNSKPERNTFYTNTFGDGKLPPPPPLVNGWYDAGDKKYRGSQRNMVTTNIMDYYDKSKDYTKPNLFGPDAKNPGDYVGLVKRQTRLYHKPYKDPETDDVTVMQRLIFYQKVKDYEVRVKITQRFDSNNRVIVNHEFTNFGTRTIDNFTGYVFRDVTFMTGHTMKKQKEVTSFRSLGNNNGVYSSSATHHSRVEFTTDEFTDNPYAWAGRGTESTFYKASKKLHFPWSYNGVWEKADAFKNINDTGDKDIEPGFGKTWMQDHNGGISMHTKNQSLQPRQTVTMSYGVKMVPLKKEPEFKINDSHEKDKPLYMQPEQEKVVVKGLWRHAYSDGVQIKYLIRPVTDSIDANADKAELLEKGINVTPEFQTQEPYDREEGVPQAWSTEIKLNQLSSGTNEVYAIAMDQNNPTGYSKIRRTYINVREREPTLILDIETPKTTFNQPYIVNAENNFPETIDISGKSFSGTEKYELTYSIDNEDERKILMSDDHADLKNSVKWTLKDFSFKEFLNKPDYKKHSVNFLLKSYWDDGTGNLKSSYKYDVFYFKVNEDGYMTKLHVPGKINFGINNMTPKSIKDAKPNFAGDFYLDDYREEKHREKPLNVVLKTEDFKSTKKGSEEILNTEIFWGNNAITDQGYRVVSDGPTRRTYLTDVVKEKLHMKIKQGQNVKDGKFTSRWTWIVRDAP